MPPPNSMLTFNICGNRSARSSPSTTCRSRVEPRPARRPARPERRRQDDDGLDDRRAAHARRAARCSIDGARSRGDTDPTKRRIGLVPQDLALYDELSRAREPALLRRALRPARARRSTQAIAVGARPRRPRRSRARPRQDLQRRHEAAAEPRRRPAARSRHPAARRADGRRRSAEPQRDLRQPRGAEGARQGAALHDALHGRGRAARRPHRHHRPRQGDRRRHARRAAGARRAGRGGERARSRSVFLTLTGRSLRD